VPRKLIVVVIDGLAASTFESAVDDRRTPALALLAEHGTYRRAVSVFPSLTPVCLSSLATGAYPDVHHIPHLVWYHRGEGRLVEYGSSFAALRRAGTRRGIVDAIFKMNQEHLSTAAVTMFEAVEDAGLTAAAVNLVCYRGRTRHRSTLRGLTRSAYGPKRFFYFNLFESDVTGAPIAVGGRAAGSSDRYAAAVGRWLVTRDGFDLLVCYLPDYDFVSHAVGPERAGEALVRSDQAVAALIEAAGGPDELLERYAVVVCADHGQTPVDRAVKLERRFARVDDILVTASNRAAMVYRVGDDAPAAREVAASLDAEESVEVALFLEGDEAFARRAGEELRFRPGEDGFTTSGDQAVLDHPFALERAWRALRNPNAGEVLVSAAPGFEFADLAGRHHAGGGSHGSLTAGDSEVPMLTVGLPEQPDSITGVAPAVLAHFGIQPPAYALGRAA
jgi:predicted AlkP superfamily pyrophosphatase or phosphodiesterase